MCKDPGLTLNHHQSAWKGHSYKPGMDVKVPLTRDPVAATHSALACRQQQFGLLADEDSGLVDCVGPCFGFQAQPHCGLPIMDGMGTGNTRNRKAYAAHRWCRAIDRLLNAGSMKEKEHAIRWSHAWSTAYLRRAERRVNKCSGQNPDGMDRRRKNALPY